MNSTPDIFCLALYPVSGQLSRTEQSQLQSHLLNLSLLGQVFQAGDETRFKLGDAFYQLLSFMGCAPAIKLEPDNPTDEKFYHFRFVDYSQMAFRSLRDDVKARCRHCRKPGDTAAQVQQLSGRQDWRCPHCQQQTALQEINWKHEAGTAQFFIELLDVHPHEVVPTDGLLKELETVTGQKWEYFYCQASPEIIA